MNSKKLYFILISSLVLLASLGGLGVFYGDKMLQEKASSLISLKVDAAALEDQQRSLLQAKKDVNTYSELSQLVKTIVPQEKDQARTVREIVKIAGETGVKIGSITFPSSNLGEVAPKTVAPTDPGEKKAAPAKIPGTQIKPVEGIPGLYQLEIGIQSDSSTTVEYKQFLAFLKKLEQNRRTSQVTNLSVQPSSKDRNQVNFSLTVNVYVKP